MPSLTIQPIASFKEFVNYIEDIGARVKEPIWYRGCGKDSHKLVPSLFRNKGYSKIEDFMALEKRMISRFQQRSIPFLN
jgi:hypothetical protein